MLYRAFLSGFPPAPDNQLSAVITCACNCGVYRIQPYVIVTVKEAKILSCSAVNPAVSSFSQNCIFLMNHSYSAVFFPHSLQRVPLLSVEPSSTRIISKLLYDWFTTLWIHLFKFILHYIIYRYDNRHLRIIHSNHSLHFILSMLPQQMHHSCHILPDVFSYTQLNHQDFCILPVRFEILCIYLHS